MKNTDQPFKTNRAFTEEEKKEQIFAIVCNHKKATARGVRAITGFDIVFINTVLNEYVKKGSLKKSDSYILDGNKVDEEIFRVKKKYLQMDVFGKAESDECEDEERLIA